MSVSTSTSKISHTLTTGSQALTVPFRFLSNSHVKAIKASTSTTPKLDLVEGTDYTLTGVGASSGTLTTIATTANGLAAGSVVVIKRNVPRTQETSYTYNNDFSSTVQEQVEDKLTMLVQQLDEKVDRGLHAPEDDSSSTELPAATDRASKVVGFNAAGTAIEMKSVADGAGVVGTEGIGENALQREFRTRRFNSVAALRAQSIINSLDYDRAELLGYYAAGDGGGGPRRYLVKGQPAGTYVDNGGSIIVPTGGDGSAAWLWEWSGFINARWFGAKLDGETDDTDAWVSVLSIAENREVFFDGQSLVSEALDLPKGVHITGPCYRSILHPTWDSYKTAGFIADFAGPVLRSDDTAFYGAHNIRLSHFIVTGDKATYPSGVGIEFTNTLEAKIEDVSVSGFGQHSFSFKGTCDVITLRDCYAAGATLANYYYEGDYTVFDNCNSDGAQYSILSGTTGGMARISGGIYEGATVGAIRLRNHTNEVTGVRCAMTAGGKGIIIEGSRNRIANNRISATGVSVGTHGIALESGAYGNTIVGNHIQFFSLGIGGNDDGANTITGNTIFAEDTGIDYKTNNYFTTVSGNTIIAVSNSIIFRGGKIALGANSIMNGSGAYSPITRPGPGTTTFINGQTGEFTLSAAAETIVYDASVIAGSTIQFTPYNQAASLYQRDHGIWLKDWSAGQFTVRGGAIAVGTEVFKYEVKNIL